MFSKTALLATLALSVSKASAIRVLGSAAMDVTQIVNPGLATTLSDTGNTLTTTANTLSNPANAASDTALTVDDVQEILNGLDLQKVIDDAGLGSVLNLDDLLGKLSSVLDLGGLSCTLSELLTLLLGDNNSGASCYGQPNWSYSSSAPTGSYQSSTDNQCQGTVPLSEILCSLIGSLQLKTTLDLLTCPSDMSKMPSGLYTCTEAEGCGPTKSAYPSTYTTSPATYTTTTTAPVSTYTSSAYPNKYCQSNMLCSSGSSTCVPSEYCSTGGGEYSSPGDGCSISPSSLDQFEEQTMDTVGQVISDAHLMSSGMVDKSCAKAECSAMCMANSTPMMMRRVKLTGRNDEGSTTDDLGLDVCKSFALFESSTGTLCGLYSETISAADLVESVDNSLVTGPIFNALHLE